MAEVDSADDEGSEWWEADRGVLIVNAPPTFAHQRMVKGPLRAWAVEADYWQTFPGPQRVVLDETTWAEPDVAIWPAGQVDLATGGSVPELVAEVLSPSTVRRDRHDKPALYARAGVTWLVLAEPGETPSAEVLRLEPSGQVRRMATAVGDEPLACPLTGADLTPATIALGSRFVASSRKRHVVRTLDPSLSQVNWRRPEEYAGDG